MATAALGEGLIARPAPPPSHLRGFIEGLGRHTRISVETVGRTGRARPKRYISLRLF